MNDVATDTEATAELRGRPSRPQRPQKITDALRTRPTALTAGDTAGSDGAAGSAFHPLQRGGGGLGASMEKSNSKPTKNKPRGTKETQVNPRSLGSAVLNYCRRLLKLVLLLRLFGEPEGSGKIRALDPESSDPLPYYPPTHTHTHILISALL